MASENEVQLTAEDSQEITAKINPQELIAAWEERADRAKEFQVIVSMGARTDLGRIRENNEDKFDFYQPEDQDILALKGSLYAVADGMGGHSAGQIASELALKTTVRSYYADKSPVIEDSLKAAVQQANALVFETSRAVPDRAGMGTTMTALVVRGDEAFIAQVGDSRCYRLRDGKFTQVTEDHSWVQEQIKRGGLTKEEASQSPYRNVITRSLGNMPNVDVDIYSEELKKGDVFLLCSDGLSGEVSESDMKEALKSSSPSQAAWDLVDLALEHGGKDNATVMIVAIKDIITNKKTKRKGIGALLSRG